MLKTSMSDYEKSSAVAYPFYFINRQSIHKTNCMQIIKKILMREVFPAIALKYCNITYSINIIYHVGERLKRSKKITSVLTVLY